MYAEWDKDTGGLRAMGARCMPDDNYCYARGRAIAEGRFKKYGATADSLCSAINNVFEYTATTEADVHKHLADVAMHLGYAVTLKLPYTAMAIVRYYRSTRKFEGEV